MKNANSEFSDKYKAEEIAFRTNALEAVLFAAGDPVGRSRLAELFETSVDEIDYFASLLRKKLAASDTSYELIAIENDYQLCTKIEYAGYVSEFLKIKRTAPLSKPALEALAVIAYKQPVTRAYVERVRGVDCSGIVNTLLQRGIIEEAGRLDAPGKPILYKTTQAFLRSFGLASTDELPAIDENIQLTLDCLNVEG